MQVMARTVSIPAKAFPPGDFIREELQERGWTQQDLADRMRRPIQTVNMIVNGRKAITAETAYQLEAVFGPSAAYWMNLESSWQLYKFAEKKREAGSRKGKLRRFSEVVAKVDVSGGRAAAKEPKSALHIGRPLPDQKG